MKRNLTCIICPKGCALEAELNGACVTVTGNTCPKGKEYAISECLHPVRTVTATVRVSNRDDTMVSVKTDRPVAKDSMFAVMTALRQITVSAPLNVGDVVLKDICGSAVVITKAVQ